MFKLGSKSLKELEDKSNGGTLKDIINYAEALEKEELKKTQPDLSLAIEQYAKALTSNPIDNPKKKLADGGKQAILAKLVELYKHKNYSNSNKLQKINELLLEHFSALTSDTANSLLTIAENSADDIYVPLIAAQANEYLALQALNKSTNNTYLEAVITAYEDVYFKITDVKNKQAATPLPGMNKAYCLTKLLDLYNNELYKGNSKQQKMLHYCNEAYKFLRETAYNKLQGSEQLLAEKLLGLAEKKIYSAQINYARYLEATAIVAKNEKLLEDAINYYTQAYYHNDSLPSEDSNLLITDRISLGCALIKLYSNSLCAQKDKHDQIKFYLQYLINQKPTKITPELLAIDKLTDASLFSAIINKSDSIFASWPLTTLQTYYVTIQAIGKNTEAQDFLKILQKEFQNKNKLPSFINELKQANDPLIAKLELTPKFILDNIGCHTLLEFIREEILSTQWQSEEIFNVISHAEKKHKILLARACKFATHLQLNESHQQELATIAGVNNASMPVKFSLNQVSDGVPPPPPPFNATNNNNNPFPAAPPPPPPPPPPPALKC